MLDRMGCLSSTSSKRRANRISLKIDEIERITPSASTVGHGFKIFFSQWKGSVYQLLWIPMLMYWLAYVSLTVIYEYALNETGQMAFLAVANYCSKYTSAIPVIFLLGFFTSSALNRWFSTQTNLPGTAKVITYFTLSLKEETPNKEQLVRQFSRWVILSWILAMRIICSPFRQEYPDLKSLEAKDLLLVHEREELEAADEKDYPLPLVVIDWIFHLLKRCLREKNFNSTGDYTKNIDNLLVFKKSCGNSIKFAHKNIPFALTQAVTISVYAFGFASLMSRHFLERNPVSEILTGYFPILHSIQYFLFFAWLKFGQMAANPFGDDHDDIDVKGLCTSHIEDAERLVGLASNKMDGFVSATLEHNTKKIEDVTEDERVATTTF